MSQTLASHGVGRALHEYPEEVATWPSRGDTRRMQKGAGADGRAVPVPGWDMGRQGRDGWTLYAHPPAPAVQYEHTVVATDRDAIIVTMPG